MKSFYRIILKEYISWNLIQNIGFDDRSLIGIEKNEDRNNDKNWF